MQPNPYFPQWLTSNTIIKAWLKEFGAHATGMRDSYSNIQIAFIPHHYFCLVPKEDRDRFLELYNIFANWAAEELEIENILQKYFGKTVTQVTLLNLELDINNAIQLYRNSNRLDMKLILATCLGVVEYFTILPKSLSDRLMMLENN